MPCAWSIARAYGPLLPPPDLTASRAYAVFEIEGQKGSLRLHYCENRAVQNMGQLYCHTTPPSASTSSGSMPVASALASDNQTLCPNRRAVGFLSFQELWFGRKIGRLK